MSKIYDNRINSWNFYIETTFGEYLQFAPDIISNNNLQRKRVRTSKTVYSLLKNDLKSGCVIPPLVLALTKTGVVNIDDSDENNIKRIMDTAKSGSDEILILDGLQRTYTLIDAETEMKKMPEKDLEKFYEFKMRLEVYVEMNKFGVLYRMLTLNTGQTPMSSRHQLEMLYRDLLNTSIEGIKLVTDNEGKANSDDNEFVFKNAIEGFNSYMNRNELPLDRQELIENMKMLENMSAEDVSEDLFKEFLESYIAVFCSLRTISGNYQVTKEELDEYEISDSPFGKNISKVFSTSQALTGYGAAIGKMHDNKLINSFEQIKDMAKELEKNEIDYEWFLNMLIKFDRIKESSKKIGNAQRMFFQYFFRELFNNEGDSYLNVEDAVENGYKKYYSQVN